MAAPALGTKTYLGLGRESQWGSAVARSAFLEVNRENLDKQIADIVSPSLKHAGLHKNRVSHVGPISAGGGIEWNPNYEGSEILFKTALGGTPTSSRPDITNAPTVYDWVIPIADANTQSLSLEVCRDVKNWLYHGAVLQTLQFSVGGPNEPLVCSADFICEDGEPIETVTPPTFTTTPLIVGAEASLTWKGGALDVESCQIAIANNFEDSRRFIGSRYIAQPYRGGKLAVTGRFMTEFQSTDQYTDFVNGTRGALRILAQSATAISGAYYYKMQIDVPIGRLLHAVPMATDAGRIKVDVPFIAYRDDSNFEMQITMRNTLTSIS
jgi:hypothetical protein